MRSFSVGFLVFFLSTLTIVGCDEEVDISDCSTIVFRYGDASVAPDYHRSFSISFSSDASVQYTVDSYGDVLLDTTIIVTDSVFNFVKSAFVSHGIVNCKRTGDEGCTGGTSRTIYVKRASEVIFNGTVYLCSKSGQGNLCGDLEGFYATIEKLLPKELFQH